MTYVVAIVEQETERTVKTFRPCTSEREAERLERGVLINLDTDRYYTEIRPTADGTRYRSDLWHSGKRPLQSLVPRLA